MESLFIIWFTGLVVGSIILFVYASDASDSDKEFIDQYWFLFTILWFVGLPIFLLWASVRTYHLIKDIFRR